MAKRNRHKRRKSNASEAPPSVEASKERASSQGRPKQEGGAKGGARQAQKRRPKKDRAKEVEKQLLEGKEEETCSVEKVRRQMDFYFSDSNLRRDRFLKQTLENDDGYLDLKLLLTFNRIKALGVSDIDQLVDAARSSQLLELNADCTKVRRDYIKFPPNTHDPVCRTLYAEGLPITFGIRDIEKIFSRHGEVKLVQIPHHRETGEPRGFCLIEFGSVKVLLEASNDRVSKLQGNELDCAPLNAQEGVRLVHERSFETARGTFLAFLLPPHLPL
ncbi:LARP7 [Symbiodinium necroappetens]|uniref:LARP7 protein n=1 Tax=Symbiodinium necroappetens TaxID=1628268 RepID=A0A812TVA1_9DINO|nr:LARP7 [Symbiodinium necroappetens]